MNFEAVIGLEIHVETKTSSKMFSSAPNESLKEPNTLVAPLDMAFPGTMPVINKRAVEFAIRVAHSLNMEIARTLYFDRKNYFYSDLPKGYQITQNFHPIGSNGYLSIKKKDGSSKKIEIERVHMEEDTAKQLHFSDYTLLDYNRSGVPLLEIVSRPDIRSGEEARLYVEAIRNIVVYSGVSDGKMEEGSLRCDVNVSLRPFGYPGFGTKVEIKNLNSLKNIEEALDYEIARQASLLYEGKEIRQETRRWDESKNETILMRVKTDAVDYKYFPEPNLVPIKLSEDYIAECIKNIPELYEAKLERFIKEGLAVNEAKAILNDLALDEFYENLVKSGVCYKEASNYLLGEVLQFLNKNNLEIKDLPFDAFKVASILNFVTKNKLSHKQGGQILLKCLSELVAPEEAMKELGISALSDDKDAALAIVKEVLEANPQSIADFKAGKDRALGYLVGQAMKLSKGKIQPSLISELIKKEIS